MSSASQTPSHGQNPSGSGIVDVEDVVLSCARLELRTEGTSRQRATASQRDSASSSGFKLQEENDTKKIKNPCSHAQETSDKSQFCYENRITSRNAAADHDTMLGLQHYFTTFGENNSSDVHDHRQENLRGPMDYTNWYSNSQNFGAGTSTNSFYHFLVNNSPFLCPGLSFRPMGQYTVDNDRIREIMNTGIYSDNSRWNQESGEALAESRPGVDLNRMQELLNWGDNQQKQEVISVLKGYIFQLMTDKQINFIFYSLVDACEDDQLNSIVGDILSQSDFFVNATFCIPGANSIVKLIRRLKKSHDHAFTMTQILSIRFLDLVTDRTARRVIRECLTFFGTQPNKILHKKAIDNFKFLAIHKVGSVFLRDSINTISGEQKVILLDKIAQVSDSLANDPFGNFIVQNVLALRDMNFTAKILKCLKGQFVYLSQKKGGSHVVEKCMESSYLGLESVVQEIVETPKAALLLAQDQFGNYVVQTALKKTQTVGCGHLHCSLLKCLVPYCGELNRTKAGRHIIHLLQQVERLSSSSRLSMELEL